MWPQQVKADALVACGRSCCICHEFCGTNIELHHIDAEADGGSSTIANCIPLCFDCHADVGHYNVRHPKGTKYSRQELIGHRDKWFAVQSALASAERAIINDPRRIKTPTEVYERQLTQFRGFVWRQAFPGRPNYEAFPPDEKETCWMLILPEAFTLFVASFEDADVTIAIPDVKMLHLVLNAQQYQLHRNLVMHDAVVTGRVLPRSTGHHHGDALLDVTSIECADLAF